MRLTKMDCTLNEKDTLQDLLESEKQLMALYTTVLYESGTNSVRKNISTNLLGVAENQLCIFNQMQTRGLYQPQPATKQMLDEANATFKKQKKELKAN